MSDDVVEGCAGRVLRRIVRAQDDAVLFRERLGEGTKPGEALFVEIAGVNGDAGALAQDRG